MAPRLDSQHGGDSALRPRHCVASCAGCWLQESELRVYW